jgi:four helix bundle protein
VIAYEKFEAWKVAHRLALEVYEVSDRWPACERYQITAQIRRAALSIPTNIAEGAAKRGAREFRRYLDIANGSLAELSYLLRFTKDRGLISQDTFLLLNDHRDHTGRLTYGLYASLGKRQTWVSRPTDRLTD